MMSLEVINRLQQDLARVMSGLDQLKQQLITANSASFIPAPPPMSEQEFAQLIYQTLLDNCGDERDFTDETYQRLYNATKGDGETLAVWLGQVSKRSNQPESLGGYAVGVFKKIGIDMIRAEQYGRGQRGEPAPIPTDEAGLAALTSGLSSEAATELIERIRTSQQNQAAQDNE